VEKSEDLALIEKRKYLQNNYKENISIILSGNKQEFSIFCDIINTQIESWVDLSIKAFTVLLIQW